MTARRPASGPILVLVLASSIVLATHPRAQAPGPGGTIRFRDITRESGITFVHHAAPEKKYIVESMSGGVAMFDFDNDGLLDLYFVDSLTVETARDRTAARSALYRNLGNGRFADVTDRSGLGHPGWGMGVCTADIDGDGYEDVYVTALGGNSLYRNEGNGTFTDVTSRAAVAFGGWSTGCAFGDYDRDGDLDLFVSRYVHVDLDNLPQFGRDKTCEYRGIAVQCGPRGLPGESDALFRNDGNWRFTEVSEQSGVADPRAYFGLGAVWFDYDEDGWPDLYVANDATPNFLYVNQKNGTLKESAFPMGVAVSDDGSEQGSMGIAVGDYDNGGRLSLFVTNFAEEYNNLFRNVGTHFTDMSFASQTAPSSLPYVGWGTAFADFDNDGWLDIIVVNGHVYPQLDAARLGASAGYRQRRLLYRNRRNGTFDEIAGRLGHVLMEDRVGRGLTAGDLDNDGRVDIVVNDLDGSPQVLHNESEQPGNWLIVRLKGPATNTSAVGAVVKVRTGTLVQQRVVLSGSSYLSQDDKRLQFGLGSSAQADSVDVRWPDGTTTAARNVKANRIFDLRQASGTR